MIYELLYPLSHKYGWAGFLNVLRYIPFRVIAATVTAIIMSFVMTPWFIRQLQKKQIGQMIRDDGPETHAKKAGTPTMGGSLIILSLLVPTFLWAEPSNPFVLATMAITAGYGAIGYLDDYLKIRHKNPKGLPGRYKLLGQFAIGFAVIGYCFLATERMPEEWVALRGHLSVPFVAFSKHPIVLPLPVYVLFATFVVVAMSNAVNLTDGLDGLAIGPVMINAGTYLVWAYVASATFVFHVGARALTLPHYLDIFPSAAGGELAVFCGALIGSGMGFLWYNAHPAQVFMGDVGALALGGGLGMLAVFTKNELLSILLGGVFFVEAVSVIIQVFWFKLTGKRVFLMAPIHHHFERRWSEELKLARKGDIEPLIVVRFWIISILLALLALMSIKVR